MSVIAFTPSLIDDEIIFSLLSHPQVYIGNQGLTAKYDGPYDYPALTNRPIKYDEVFRVAVSGVKNFGMFQMGLTKIQNAKNDIKQEEKCCFMNIKSNLIKIYKNDQVINERRLPVPLHHKDNTLYSICKRDNGTVHFAIQGVELGEVQLDDEEEMFVYCVLSSDTKDVSIFKI